MNKHLPLAALSFLLTMAEAFAFSGNYEIVNRNSGMVLNVAGASKNDGALVHQWVGNSTDTSQLWTLTSIGTGYYIISNVNSGLVLEGNGWGTTNGVIVDQWTYAYGYNQQWQVTSLGNGCYELINRNSTNALEVAGWSLADGGSVDEWTYAYGNNQQWLILPVGATNSLSPSSGGSGVAATNFHGFNWSNPTNSNYVDGPILPTGLNITDNYSNVEATAGVVLGAFQQAGADTVRIGINPESVIGTWWGSYQGAIDKATSMGMKVIIGAWDDQAPLNQGMVHDFTTFWQMWDTVVTNYNGNPNVYFEIYNEPWVYQTNATEWLNIVGSWLAKYPTVAHGRVFIESPILSIPSLATNGITSGCLFSIHDYGAYSPSVTNSSYFYNSLSNEVGAYANRTVLTEFGANMAGGENYAGGDLDNDVGSIIGFCTYCCVNQMGSLLWYGARYNTGSDFDYAMFTFNANTMSINSASGLDLIKYGWSDFVLGSGTYYQMVNGNSGLALEVSGWATNNGANVDQWTYGGGNNQQWVLTSVGSGYYKILNHNSGMALEVSGWSTNNGANVDQWTYGGGYNQQWLISTIGDGFYEIINRNSGLALEVAGSSSTNGANVDQSAYTGGTNQEWTFGHQ